MMCKLLVVVQMELNPHDCTYKCCVRLSLGGHRCGACHNTSDAEVNIQNPLKKKAWDIIILMLMNFWVCLYEPCLSLMSVYIELHSF